MAMLVSAGAAAQTSERAIVECRSIVDSAARLACYDAIGANAGPASAPASASAPAATAAKPPETTSSATASAAPRGGNASTSLIDAAWGFDPATPKFDISFYNPNYILVGRYSDRVNRAPFEAIAPALGEDADLNHTEAKFQISFKTRIWATDDHRWGAWLAYTQQNQWQVYNGDVSRPFRETNYMPEAFVSYRPGIELPGGFQWNLVDGGFNHQSNGRSDLLSRSWNRLFAEAGVDNGDLALIGRVWYRIKESEQDDDNPDITDYMGHGQLSAIWRWHDNSFTGTLRGNVNTGKGSVELGWHSPPIIGKLRAYVQFFSGYGESMIDYNWRQTTIGAGVSLSDGL
jgi:phospholipase A1/A2